MTRFLPLALLWIISPTLVAAADIYRWVDENGQINYSNSVPASAKSRATAIDLSATTVTSAQREEAEVRNAKLKAQLREYSETRISRMSLIPDLPSRGSSSQKSACEQEWERFEESHACFNPYRLVGGGVRPEGFQHCAEVKKPEPCY